MTGYVVIVERNVSHGLKSEGINMKLKDDNSSTTLYFTMDMY